MVIPGIWSRGSDPAWCFFFPTAVLVRRAARRTAPPAAIGHCSAPNYTPLCEGIKKSISRTTGGYATEYLCKRPSLRVRRRGQLAHHLEVEKRARCSFCWPSFWAFFRMILGEDLCGLLGPFFVEKIGFVLAIFCLTQHHLVADYLNFPEIIVLWGPSSISCTLEPLVET